MLKHYAYIISATLLLFCGHCCPAQILNIEKFRLDKDTFNIWMGNISFGFNTKKQKNTVTTLNSASNLVYLSKKHSYLSINRINLIFVEDSKLISEGYAHLRFNLWRRKTLSYEPFLQYQFDLGRGLDKRELAGLTLRVQLKTGDKYIVAFNSGIMYEHELWKGNVLRKQFLISEGIAETFFTKSTTNLSVRANLSSQLSLFLTSYYQARFVDFFNPRVISDISLMIKISNNFAITNQFLSFYDASPILDENSFTYTYNTNFTINF